jgi:hypothetical protein
LDTSTLDVSKSVFPDSSMNARVLIKPDSMV